MTDMFSEGYIGISTRSAKIRFANHKSASKEQSKSHLPIYRAFAKYGIDNLVMQVLVVGSEEYITNLEIQLRPKEGIGWNCAMGGQDTGKGRTQTEEEKEKRASKIRGQKRTDETKRKMSVASKGVPKSDAHKEKCRVAALGNVRSEELKQRQSEVMTGRIKITDEGRKRLSEYQKNLPPWCRSRSDKSLWVVADVAYDLSQTADVFSQRNLAKSFDVKDSSVGALYKKIKSGWNPLEDTAWLAFKEQYLIEKESNEITCTT